MLNIETSKTFVSECREAAKQGNVSAQMVLADNYRTGHLLRQNDRLAAYWYRKAAIQGNAHAQECLSTCYILGKGVSKSSKKALYWMALAAEQGEASAQLKLANMYELEVTVPTSYENALIYYEKALEQGFSPVDIPDWENQDPSKMRTIFEEYHSQELSMYRNLLNYVGTVYYEKIATPVAFIKAKEWFEFAAYLGDSCAQHNIGVMYLYGKGVEKSEDKAKEWFMRAADNGHEGAKDALEMLRDSDYSDKSIKSI